jgi:glutamate synthase domain-containing protein 2
MRSEFIVGSLIIIIATIALGTFFHPGFYYSFLITGPIIFLGIQDLFQTKHAIRSNFPIMGRFRYLFEKIRPEINQYFVESNTDGRPFSREERSLVYQRSKCALDTLPFGTQMDVYKEGYEWLSQSMAPIHVEKSSLRVMIGGPDCKQPYNASLLNISAMSYGSLSGRAVLALNGGAKDGGFAHNTGEGGISPFHLAHGGDLVWQIGTGYFGCRAADGGFDPDKFKEKANLEEVKMIEIKISQGAKPGHGGMLPGKKVTEEIAAIRGVPLGKDVNSPPGHSAFSTPVGLCDFIAKLRSLSNGKPIGFKLCVGKRREFISVCKAMVKTGTLPDFIVVDGGEGGTGAAPLEFSNRIGSPGVDGLIFVHNALVGFNLRDKIKIIATGKASSGFGIIKRLCLGADLVYAARSMMMALGCIQALRCNSNDCPTGVATQDPKFVKGLHVASKRVRVKNFHSETLESVAHMLGAMGVADHRDLKPWHLSFRKDEHEIAHYGRMYEYLKGGELLNETTIPESYKNAVSAANPDTFDYLHG